MCLVNVLEIQNGCSLVHLVQARLLASENQKKTPVTHTAMSVIFLFLLFLLNLVRARLAIPWVPCIFGDKKVVHLLADEPHRSLPICVAIGKDHLAMVLFRQRDDLRRTTGFQRDGNTDVKEFHQAVEQQQIQTLLAGIGVSRSFTDIVWLQRSYSEPQSLMDEPVYSAYVVMDTFFVCRSGRMVRDKPRSCGGQHAYITDLKGECGTVLPIRFVQPGRAGVLPTARVNEGPGT